MTVTTGADPDTDGYFMFDRDGSSIGSDISSQLHCRWDIGFRPIGTTTASALIPENYRVAIHNVAPNCNTPLASAETIRIVAGVETSLTLEFTCVAATHIAFVRAGRAAKIG
jgi:hypothetical protein